MPTVVKFISKLALFVLVIAVSGVSAAQVHTAPDPTLPSEEVTPDLGEKPAHLYGASEQTVLNEEENQFEFETYGNLIEYDDLQQRVTNHPVINDLLQWRVYEIDGYNNRFFIVADGSAWTAEPGHSITSIEIFARSKGGESRLVRWEPAALIRSSAQMTTTLNLGVRLGGVTSGIQRQFNHRSSVFQPTVWNGGRNGVDGSDWYSVIWMGDSGMNNTVGPKFVTYWEGDIEDVEISLCGHYKESIVSGERTWGNCYAGGT